MSGQSVRLMDGSSAITEHSLARPGRVLGVPSLRLIANLQWSSTSHDARQHYVVHHTLWMSDHYKVCHM